MAYIPGYKIWHVALLHGPSKMEMLTPQASMQGALFYAQKLVLHDLQCMLPVDRQACWWFPWRAPYVVDVHVFVAYGTSFQWNIFRKIHACLKIAVAWVCKHAGCLLLSTPCVTGIWSRLMVTKDMRPEQVWCIGCVPAVLPAVSFLCSCLTQ